MAKVEGGIAMTVHGLWVARALRERGLILQLLRESIGPVDTVALRQAMATLGTPVDRQHYGQHLEYLEQKNYIRLETKTLGRLSVQLAELTAKGRDLLFGLMVDSGITTDVDGPVSYEP